LLYSIFDDDALLFFVRFCSNRVCVAAMPPKAAAPCVCTGYCVTGETKGPKLTELDRKEIKASPFVYSYVEPSMGGKFASTVIVSAYIEAGAMIMCGLYTDDKATVESMLRHLTSLPEGNKQMVYVEDNGDRYLADRLSDELFKDRKTTVCSARPFQATRSIGYEVLKNLRDKELLRFNFGGSEPSELCEAIDRWQTDALPTSPPYAPKTPSRPIPPFIDATVQLAYRMFPPTITKKKK
jgi:Arc/MetJ family transcription regulator